MNSSKSPGRDADSLTGSALMIGGGFGSGGGVLLLAVLVDPPLQAVTRILTNKENTTPIQRVFECVMVLSFPMAFVAGQIGECYSSLVATGVAIGN
jgi:hypothetical protein